MTERVNIDDTDMDDTFAYLVNGEYFTGEVVETLPTGQIVGVTPVVNGDPHGLDRAWFADGTLRIEQHMVKGCIVGKSRKWHPNGMLAEEREFDEQGNLVGEKSWSDDGRPQTS